MSILCSEYNYNDNNSKDDLADIDPVKVLNKKVFRKKKFALLSTMIKDYVDLFLISETKIDTSSPTVQFHANGYTIHR